MTARSAHRSTNRRTFALRVCALALVFFALASSHHPQIAYAQSPDELKAARELFSEAFKDEQDKRYPEALEKFQRVARVKESPAVRYRIATVLAAMGRLREARDMYLALAATKSSSQAPSDQEIADSSVEKSAELDRRIPKLALRLQDNPPADARVMVDGAPVPVSSTAHVIELDPGDHVVSATARGAPPTEEKIALVDGAGEVPHTVTFAVTAQPNGDRGGGGNGGDKTTPAPKQDHTLSWIAIGGGSALVLIGGVVLIGREGAINDIKTTCPNRVCPAARRDDVEGDMHRAEAFAPLGVGLIIVGIAAVGYGIYTLVKNPSPTSTHANARLDASRQRSATSTHLLLPTVTVGGSRLVVAF